MSRSQNKCINKINQYSSILKKGTYIKGRNEDKCINNNNKYK